MNSNRAVARQMRDVHERYMNRRIRRILAANRKHPERCISLKSMMQQPIIGTGVISLADMRVLFERMYASGEMLTFSY